ncbi:PEP-CTERM sorting domain-containing protein [Paucibacter sp. AS339]|uniref:PEP-CTERM sorting domain-containing protein n=1 Tax=Paucibacter hankyongi TaxID=3133434 RepID=UPI0030A368E1
MQRKNRLSLAFVAAGCIASTPVFAAPVLLSQTFQLSNALDRNSVSLNFDLGSFLSGKGYGSKDIVSGNATLHGFSDSQYGAATATVYSGYQVTGQTSHQVQYSYYAPDSNNCGSWWNSYQGEGPCRDAGSRTAQYSIQDTISTHYRDIKHEDLVADSMKLLIGDSSASDVAESRSSSVGNYGGAQYENTFCKARDSRNNCIYDKRYAQQRDTYSAIYGALDTSLSFDAAALLDVRGDGILGVDVQATAGQFKLNSISFDVMVEKAAAVPEPASLLLASSALAGLVLTTRRRRKVSTDSKH